MSIVNREMHQSAQRWTMEMNIGGPAAVAATGQTFLVGLVPMPCSLDMIQLSALGISGSPTGQFQIQRFIVGTGITLINIGSTFAIGAYSTSGVISLSVGVSLPSMGSTLTTLQANDQIIFSLGGTNSACYSVAGGVVLRPIQDQVQYFKVV